MRNLATELGAWRTGDLEPALVVRLESDGAPVLLTSASGASVSVGGAVPDAQVLIVDDGTEANRGLVRYVWQAGDTDAPGVYDVEVRVDWGGGREQSFPDATGRAVVRISDGLA